MVVSKPKNEDRFSLRKRMRVNIILVRWEVSDIRWASRWDTYLEMGDVQIHWFSIINSIVVVFFLAGILAMIIGKIRIKLGDYWKTFSSNSPTRHCPVQQRGRGAWRNARRDWLEAGSRWHFPTASTVNYSLCPDWLWHSNRTHGHDHHCSRHVRNAQSLCPWFPYYR